MSAGHRVRYGALLALLATAIFFSGSRAGLIAAPAALGLLLLLQRRSRVRTAVGGVVAGASTVAYGLASGALSSTLDRASGVSGQLSDASRITDYQQAFHEVVGRPIIGHGFEVIRFSHSNVLALLHAGGVIALVGFGIFVIGAARIGRRLGRDPRVPADMQMLAIGLTASVGVWVLTTEVENLVFDRYLYVPSGLLLGMYFVRARLAQSP
jgi:O-antigen ligase